MGTQALKAGNDSSNHDRSAPVQPSVSAMASGRTKNPPRRLYMTWRNSNDSRLLTVSRSPGWFCRMQLGVVLKSTSDPLTHCTVLSPGRGRCEPYDREIMHFRFKASTLSSLSSSYLSGLPGQPRTKVLELPDTQTRIGNVGGNRSSIDTWRFQGQPPS